MSTQTETKVDSIVKVVLVFFVCLLSFSVGTYVGKRFSDYQHRIAQLTGETSQGTKSELSSLEVTNRDISVTASNSEAMTSEDVAKLAASLDQAESETVDLSKTKTDSGQERDIASTTSLASPAAAATTGNIEADTKEKETSDAKAIGTATSSSLMKGTTTSSQVKEVKENYAGKFTVQIGSFPTEAEAEKLTKELVKNGISAFYITAKVADKNDESKVKTWYRVNVGLYSSSKEAETSKSELISSKAISNGFVQKINE